MYLSEKTLQKLRSIINEESEYRSGPNLVSFFNEFGFDDEYGDGFPSRWYYTDACLAKINDTEEIEKCIKKVFAPINFLDNLEKFYLLVDSFNKYLQFDGFKLVRNGKNIDIIPDSSVEEIFSNSDGSDKQKFDEIKIDLSLLFENNSMKLLMEDRLEEINKAIKNSMNLSAIIMCGSFLEGCLYALENKFLRQFNTCPSSPKTPEGKVKNFRDWKLSESIDVANKLGYLTEDITKFSHSLRDFRNYIHPYEQFRNGFKPTKSTMDICTLVLQSAISAINQKLKAMKGSE